jgi:tetratricopeptide (TPR) repeat protein
LVLADKHALVQQAAYETLLRSRRQQLNARIGDVLEARFDDLAKMHPELLGHHFSEAGLPERAIKYWLAAGRIAASRYAHIEAASHAKRGLSELMLLPADNERDADELDLRIILGSALIATEGYAAGGSIENYEKARRLVAHANQRESGDAILSGLFMVYYHCGEHRKALEVSQELLARAEQTGNPLSMSAGHRQVGAANSILGEFRVANEHCRKAFELFDLDEYPNADYRFVQDLGVGAACQWAITCWHLGEIDKSLELSQRALARVTQLRHPHTTAYGVFYTGIFAMFRRDFADMERYGIQLQEPGSLPQWIGRGHAIEGSSLAQAGKVAEGIEKIEIGLRLCEGAGSRSLLPVFLSGLAEAQMRTGRFLEATQTLDRAFAVVNSTEERWANAELWRLRGALALASKGSTGVAEAGEHFRRGLETAQAQGSKMLALRLITSLARLWADQGRFEQARQSVAEALAQIHGGRDTPDLKEANAFLSQLP